MIFVLIILVFIGAVVFVALRDETKNTTEEIVKNELKKQSFFHIRKSFLKKFFIILIMHLVMGYALFIMFTH